MGPGPPLKFCFFYSSSACQHLIKNAEGLLLGPPGNLSSTAILVCISTKRSRSSSGEVILGDTDSLPHSV